MAIRQAIDLLKNALPQIPLSAEVHKAVLQSIDRLARHATDAETPPGARQTALRNLVSSQGKNAMMDQVASALGPAGGAGMPGAGAGGAQPAAPPPGASPV